MIPGVSERPGAGSVLVVEGLSRAEQADLVDHLPAGSAEIRAQELRQGELGEPVTGLVLLTLSFAGIAGLCAWLASKGRDIKWTFEVRGPGLSGSFGLEISGGETPEQVTRRLAGRGAAVPGAPAAQRRRRRGHSPGK